MVSTSPQNTNHHKDELFTQFENTLLEKLTLAELSGSDFRVVLVILRKTSGFNKNADWISYTQFEKFTGLTRKSVSKSLARLINAKILLVTNREPLHYKINPNTDNWVVTKRKLVTKCTPTSYQMVTQVVTKRKHTKETITKETITKEHVQESKEFLEFWNLYPRKQSKVDAEKKYKILVKDGYHEKIIQGLQRYLRYWKQHKTEPRYIPLPTSWLNAQRWNDDLDIKPMYQERKLDLPPGWVPPPSPKRASSDLLKLSRERFEELKRTGLFLNTT